MPSNIVASDAARLPCRIVTALMLAAIMAAIVWSCWTRGAWYDEFYTQFVSRADVPWHVALRESWIVDNHPPLFYALARATAWMGGIDTHRLLNLLIGAAAAAGGLFVVREVPRLGPAAATLVLAIGANQWTMTAGSELRSYFLSLCAGGVLALGLCAIRLTGTAGSHARQAVYWTTALLVFNTHIVTSLTSAVLVGVFLLAALVRRDWREARAIALAPLVAGAIFTAITAVQLPIWLNNTTVFWITGGFHAARWTLEMLILRTLVANPVLLAGALAGGVLLARDVLWQHRPSGEAGALALLVLGVLASIAGLVALHLMRPIVVEKYLMVLIAAIMMGMALAFSRLLSALGPRVRTVLFILAAGVSVPALLQNARDAATEDNWFSSGRAVAAMVRQCPGSVVHTGEIWNDDLLAMLPRDNARVVPYSYRYVADRLDFRLEPKGSKRMGQRCPTIFWGEHDTSRRVTLSGTRQRLEAEGWPPMPALGLRHIGGGWIAVLPPQS